MMKLFGIALMGLLLCPPLPAHSAQEAENAALLGQIGRLERVFYRTASIAEVFKCAHDIIWHPPEDLDMGFHIDSDRIRLSCGPPWFGPRIQIPLADLEREHFTIRQAVYLGKTRRVLVDRLAASDSRDGEHPSDALWRIIVQRDAMRAALVNVRDRIENERHRAEAEKRLQELRRSLEESDGKSAGSGGAAEVEAESGQSKEAPRLAPAQDILPKFEKAEPRKPAREEAPAGGLGNPFAGWVNGTTAFARDDCNGGPSADFFPDFLPFKAWRWIMSGLFGGTAGAISETVKRGSTASWGRACKRASNR